MSIALVFHLLRGISLKRPCWTTKIAYNSGRPTLCGGQVRREMVHSRSQAGVQFRQQSLSQGDVCQKREWHFSVFGDIRPARFRADSGATPTASGNTLVSFFPRKFNQSATQAAHELQENLSSSLGRFSFFDYLTQIVDNSGDNPHLFTSSEPPP